MRDLAGKTVLLTRAAGDADAWAQVIEDRGGRVFHLACIEVQPIRDPGTAASLASALADADWLALTSARGVEAVRALHPAPLPPRLRIAAVGATTAEAAREHLGRVDLVPPEGTGRALAEALARALAESGGAAHARVVAAAADRAQRHVEEVLEPLGTWVSRIAVYRTVPSAPRERRQELGGMGIDAVFLASPSAAQGLVNQANVPPEIAVLSIGPTTTEAARRLGLHVTAEAPRPDLAGLLELLT